MEVLISPTTICMAIHRSHQASPSTKMVTASMLQWSMNSHRRCSSRFMVKRDLTPTDLAMTLVMGEWILTSLTTEILLFFLDTTGNLDMKKEMTMV